MSESLTNALRGWIARFDAWAYDGVGEAPTTNELCAIADGIDEAARDEVAYAIAQHENDLGDWVVPIRCRECKLKGWAGEVMTCDRYPESRHETRPDGWCAWAVR